MTLVGESASQSDLGQRRVGVREHVRGVFDPPFADVLTDGRLVVLTEFARQMHRMNPCDSGQLGETRGQQIRVLERFTYAPQPTGSIRSAHFTDGARALRQDFE